VLLSPYAPGSRPGYLAGRGQQLEQVRRRSARLAQLGRSGGPLLAFVGPRGLGKTSLLRQAETEARQDGFLTTWVTGRDDRSVTAEISRSLSGELASRSLAQRARGLVERLDAVQVEVGLPGAKVGVELDTSSGPTSAPAQPDLRSLLAEAGTTARGNDLGGLVVFVDELQDARLEDRRSLLIALQELDADHTGAPVAVVAAGLPSLYRGVPDAATFGERTDWVEIGLLGDVAVAEALREPAEALGVSWSDAAVVAAIDLAAGYPHKAQLVGDETWDAARPGVVGSVIEPGHVALAAERVEERMARLFDSRLNRVTAEQRRLVAAMAEAAGGTDRAVARADLAGLLEQAPRALSRPRQELVDKGLIAAAGHGMLRFTIPGFSAYARRQLGDASAGGDAGS